MDSRIVYTRDANGNILTKETDYSNDGKINAKVSYEIDASGNVIKAEFDNDNSGNIDRTEYYTLDTYGNISKVEYDTDSDGVIDSNITHERNALGYITKSLFDENNDGIIDSVTTYERDIYGNPIREVNDSDNNPETANQVITREYDELGRLVTVNSDYVYRYTYNELNQVTKVEHYTLDTNQLTSTRWNYYDENGRDTRWEVDNTGDGKVDFIRYFDTYNATWNKVETMHETTGTGATKWSAKVEYDTLGQAKLTYKDDWGDGTVNNLLFGNIDAAGISSQEDLTQWTDEQISQINNKLVRITLSNSEYNSTLTLNSETLAKINPNNKALMVDGDSTDTVNLVGGDFVKTTEGSTYTYYTTAVDGTTYTVLVDNDINTVLG